MITAAQRDAYARHGRAEILRIEPTGESRWTAILADSILYAEGGGQPWDLGTLGGVPVLAVRKGPDGLAHELSAPVPVGEVEVVLDWARRYDHMQQHTGQHLLSALALDRFGWATTSFHLQPGLDAVCDVELDAPDLGWSSPSGPGIPDLTPLQDLVNQAIRDAHPVQAREYDQLPAGIRSRGLPEGFVGPVRLVEIEGIDLNTCGGTHVRSTAELQAIALLGAERIRGGTRVSFAVGERVVRRLVEHERRLVEAGGLLSRGAADVVDGVRRAIEDAKAQSRRAQALADELADVLGGWLAASAGPVRVLHRDDGDTAFLNRVASAALKQVPDAILWLTAGGDDGAFLLAGPADRVNAVKARVLEILGAKGGGPPGRLQGRATRLGRRGEVPGVLG